MKRIKKVLTTIKRAFIISAAIASTAWMHAMPVYAGGLQDSNLATGTRNLIEDATKWLLILAPIISTLLVIFFCIRRGMADEMDQKKWNNRIITVIISCIGAVIASATLNVLIGYYS